MTSTPVVRDRLPRVVWIVSAIAFCVAIGYGIVAPAVPGYARQFGVGRTAAALVVSIFALARILSAFGGGRLVDRLGARRVLGAGLLIVAVSSALAATAQSYLQLLLMRGAGGVGSAMFSVASASVLAAAVPNAVRGRAMGVYSGAFLLGTVTGPVLGGPLTAASLRLPFVFYAAMLTCAAGIAFTALPRLARAVVIDARDDRREGIREALRIPLFRAALFSAVTGGWAMAIRAGTVPLFVAEALRAGPTVTGLGLTVYAAANGLLLWPAGRLSDRWGRGGAMLAAAVLSGASLVLLALPPGLALFYAAMVLGGAGAAAQSVGPAAVVGDVAGGRRGSVIATSQVAGDVGVICGPLVANAIVDRTGSYPFAMLTTAAVAGSAAVVLLVVRRTARDRTSST